jgi:4-hydroxyphenylpyruvate dioxygenase-like putative hemolysin
MNEYNLNFHHLGLAVQKPEGAVCYLRGLGYAIGSTVFDAEQNAQLILCRSETMPDVEIIFPGEGSSPVDAIVRKHGSSMYHVCYTSPDAAESIRSIQRSGLRVLCVAKPKAAILFDGRPVSFYNVAGFGLIEVIDLKDT